MQGYSDLMKPFVFHCNVSLESLGAVLHQRESGKLVVIAYGTKTLTPPKKNYHLQSGKSSHVCDVKSQAKCYNVQMGSLLTFNPPSNTVQKRRIGKLKACLIDCCRWNNT